MSQSDIGKNIPIIDKPVVISTGLKRPTYQPKNPVVTYFDPSSKTIERRRLSDREYKYIQLRCEGAEKKEALVKAGYSITSSEFNENMLEDKAYILEFLNKLPEYLKEQGINDDFLAKKFHEWFNAMKTIKIIAEKKIVNTDTGPEAQINYVKIQDPDYETQLKALDRLQKLTEIGQNGVTKRVTYEEFLGGGKK
jgi:hypothetical protein